MRQTNVWIILVAIVIGAAGLGCDNHVGSAPNPQGVAGGNQDAYYHNRAVEVYTHP